jgi:hypothetical protein
MDIYGAASRVFLLMSLALGAVCCLLTVPHMLVGQPMLETAISGPTGVSALVASVAYARFRRLASRT